METTEIIKSNCRGCHGGCGVLVHVVDGRITKIKGDPDFPTNRGGLCSKGLAFPDLVSIIFTDNDPKDYDVAVGATNLRVLLCNISRCDDKGDVAFMAKSIRELRVQRFKGSAFRVVLTVNAEPWTLEGDLLCVLVSLWKNFHVNW